MQKRSFQIDVSSSLSDKLEIFDADWLRAVDANINLKPNRKKYFKNFKLKI